MVAHKKHRLSPIALPFVASKLPSTLEDSEEVVNFNPLAEPFTPSGPLSPSQCTTWVDYLDAPDQFYPPGYPFNKHTFEPYTSENPRPAMTAPTKFAPSISATEFNLRKSTLSYRKPLLKSKHAIVCAGNTPVVELPQALFLAASTKPELLVNGVVQLAEYIDPRGVVILHMYLTRMIHWHRSDHGYRLSSQMDIYDMLTVTAAAALLGMDQYVDHIYRKCDAQLHNDLLSYDDLDAITYFVQEHPRLMRVVARKNLAPRMRSGDIPDPEQFAHYLSENVILGHEIHLAHAEHSASLYDKQNRLEHRQARINRSIQARTSHDRTQAWAKERKQWNAGRAQHELERQKLEKEREKRDKESVAQDKVFWDKKKGEDAEDEQSIHKKL